MTRDDFESLMRGRREYQIYPSEQDRKFFESYGRAGKLRQYNVRASFPTDDYDFAVGLRKPDDFITIVSRSMYCYWVLPADVARCGAVVNSDAYANFRLNEEEKLITGGSR